jgi:hypothetical protein
MAKSIQEGELPKIQSSRQTNRHVSPDRMDDVEAFSISEFCRRYGVSRSLAYDQIKAGYLKAHKPRDCDRTFILRADAQRWAEDAPVIQPKNGKAAEP